MKQLHIAADFALPIELVTQTSGSATKRGPSWRGRSSGGVGGTHKRDGREPS